MNAKQVKRKERFGLKISQKVARCPRGDLAGERCVAGRAVAPPFADIREGSLREGAPAQQVEEYASYREHVCKKVSRVVTSKIFKVTKAPSVAQMRATFLSEEGFLDLRIGCAAVCGSGIAGSSHHLAPRATPSPTNIAV